MFIVNLAPKAVDLNPIISPVFKASTAALWVKVPSIISKAPNTGAITCWKFVFNDSKTNPVPLSTINSVDKEVNPAKLEP